MPVLGSSWKRYVLSVLLAATVSAVGQTGFVEPNRRDRTAVLPSGIADGTPAVTTSAQDDSPNPPSSSSAAAAPGNLDSGNPIIKLMPRSETKPSDRFQWKPALAQYSLEIAIQHGWRFVHEPGTVDATGYGPWFHDWINSIGETRGWDDGDGWHAGFVGHPLNGAIYGFIEQQNDPRYREVEWGDGRIYWMSRLRAMAFSALASTQWTLGPLSEASLGNVQLHASPGFIDLVNTPGLGVFVMMGEDMLDRYVIIPVENHTANPWFILVMRTLGNPARSFANLMAFKYGWTRATRPGIFGANHERRKELVREYKEGLISAPFGPHTAEERAAMNKDAEQPRPREAPIELSAYAQYESFLGGGSCIGGGGQGAARVNPSSQIVSEINGCMIVNMPKYQSGDSTMFDVGPRWTPRAAHHFSPFTEVLFGGRRITHDVQDPLKRQELLDAWNKGDLPHFPKRSDYTKECQAFGFAMKMAGGFDVVFGRAFAWRVLDVAYAHSWLPAVDPLNASQGISVRSALVLRVGSW